MIYLCNTFSVHMMPKMQVKDVRNLRIRRISAIEAGDILTSNPYKSYFGHEASAWHLSRYLHLEVKPNRGTIRMKPHDVLIIAAAESKRRWEQGYKPFPGWRFYEITLDNAHDGR